MKGSILSIVLVNCFISYSVHASENKIRSVLVIARHGERYPIITYPGDQNEHYLDRMGYGILTPRGHLQMYMLGQQLKRQFPEVTQRKLTQLRSSNRERCIESISLVLAGIDGPSSNISNDPPVKTVDPSQDPMLNHGGLVCPTREEEITNDPTINHFPVTFPKLWANLSSMTGEVYNETNAFFVADVRVDPVMSALLMNLTIDWADSNTLQQLQSVHDSWVWTMSQYDISKKLSGVFYGEVIDKFKLALATDGVSFFGYSTHDTTLGPIMIHLGLWPGHRPLYGESLILVLRENSEVEFYVSDTQLNIERKHSSRCQSSPCTLSALEEGVKDMIPSDWKAECGRKDILTLIRQLLDGWFK